ncbi:MAG: AAA family ATPase [Nitrososphaerota archaeon]
MIRAIDIARPGSTSAILTWDRRRIEKFLDEAGGRFEESYLVDWDYGSVYRIVKGVREQLMAEVEVEGVKKRVKISPELFFRKILPQKKIRTLVVVSVFSSPRISMGDSPMNAGIHAIVFFTGDTEILPTHVQSRIEDVYEMYFATDEELAALAEKLKRLGIDPAQAVSFMTGLTLSEAEELCLEAENRRLTLGGVVERIKKIKDARMRALGIEQDRSIGGIFDAAIDSPYKRLLANYTSHGSLCFLGPPGSGKTYMAKRLIGTEYGDPFTIDAGRIIQQRSSEHLFLQALTYLRNLKRVGLLINEYDHLISDRRFYTRMLRFLEEARGILFTCTVINPEMILKDGVLTEAMRPGRIDEIIPVLPPMEMKTRLAMTREIAEELARQGKTRRLSSEELRTIALSAPLLYPADYISLIIKYSQSKQNLAIFVRDYDVEERERQVLELIDTCRESGNTSTMLLDTLEKMILKAAG